MNPNQMTPAQRMAAGYQLGEHERRRLKDAGHLHDPEHLAHLKDTDARLKAEGIKLPTNTRMALGYAQGYADAAKITDQNR